MYDVCYVIVHVAYIIIQHCGPPMAVVLYIWHDIAYLRAAHYIAIYHQLVRAII